MWTGQVITAHAQEPSQKQALEEITFTSAPENWPVTNEFKRPQGHKQPG